MKMTREAVHTLFSDRTYQRFLRAFSPEGEISAQQYEQLISAFMDLVLELYPAYSHDWDEPSILIHDSLQEVCIDVLREACRGATVLGTQVSSLLYRTRLLKLCFFEWAGERMLSVDEEAFSLFAGYCHCRHHDWSMGFAPYEYAMDSYDWKEELTQKWDAFLVYCSKGGH